MAAPTPAQLARRCVDLALAGSLLCGCGGGDASAAVPSATAAAAPELVASAVATSAAPEVHPPEPDDLSPLDLGPDVPPSAKLHLSFIEREPTQEHERLRGCALPGAAFLCGLRQLVLVRDGVAARDPKLEQGLPHDDSGALDGTVKGMVGRWPAGAWLVLGRYEPGYGRYEHAYRWSSDRWEAADSHMSPGTTFATWNHALVFGESTGVGAVFIGSAPTLPRSHLGRPSAVAATHSESGNVLIIAGRGPDHYGCVERWRPGAATAPMERVALFGEIERFVVPPSGELFAFGTIGGDNQGFLVRARDDGWVDIDLPPRTSWIVDYARSGRSEWLLARTGDEYASRVWARVGEAPWEEVTRLDALVPAELGSFVEVEALSLVDGVLWLAARVAAPDCTSDQNCRFRAVVLQTGDSRSAQTLPL